MDFTLIDSPSLFNNYYHHHQHQQSPESSDYEYSGTSPTISMPPPFHNAYAPPSHDHSMEAMREMIFRMAMMQPIQVEPPEQVLEPPKRKNVRISKDPQTVAARRRSERISQRIRILQGMVPGGTKLDTASMLDEAVHYMKFLKKQVETLELQGGRDQGSSSMPIMGHVVGSIYSM